MISAAAISAALQQRDEFIAVEFAVAEDGEWWLPLILATSNPALRKADTTSLPVIRGSRVTPR